VLDVTENFDRYYDCYSNGDVSYTERYGVIACMSTITQDLAHCRKLASAKVRLLHAEKVHYTR